MEVPTVVALTRELASCLDVGAVDEGALQSFLETLEPDSVEWALRDGDDGRGRLSVLAWAPTLARAFRTVEPHPEMLRLHQALPHEGVCILGVSLYEQGSSLRYYRTAPVAFGDRMGAALVRYQPALEPLLQTLLSPVGGGEHWFGGVGLEDGGEGRRRVTVYVLAPEPVALRRVLAQAGLTHALAEHPFFAELLDSYERGVYPWPQAGFARSVGREGGWKFYLSMQSRLRPEDEDLLDLGEASEPIRDAVRRVRATHAGEEAWDGGDVITFVGLSVRDDAPESPKWTYYLNTRRPE